MIDDILTEEKLCRIADHWTREKLKAWLHENHIPFIIARSGWPRVHRKALERAMGVTDEVAAKPDLEAQFNFEAVK